MRSLAAWETTDMDGIWNLHVATPMGSQDFKLTIETLDTPNTFHGVIDGRLGVQEFVGTVELDGKLVWSIPMTEPVKMSLEYEAVIDGLTMTGVAKLGSFGNATFTGSKV